MSSRQLLRRIRATTVPPGTPTAAAALPGGILAGQGRHHPGGGRRRALTRPDVMVSRTQLDCIRTQVQAGAQPWAPARQQIKSSSCASLSRLPKSRSVVDRGSCSRPNT